MKHLKKPLVNVISSSATCFWINIYADPSNQPIRFEEQVYSLRFTTRIRLYICAIHLSFPSDLRDNLWVGQHFQTGMLFQDVVQ